MNGRSLVMLVLAVALGLGAMLAARVVLNKPPEKEETQDVIVAARDFKEEEVLKPDMVKATRMAKSAVPVGAFSSFKDMEERWVKTTMLEGDVIIERKLGPKGSPPGLVANIPKGMRAFAVDVNEQSGVSGFILPGHRVDVVRFEQGEKIQQQRGETILQNILVLAAGQVFTRPEEKAVQSRTVTLAVTPEQVDVLVAAKSKGPLSLSLRGVNDHDIVAAPKPRPSEDPEAKARRIRLEKEREEEKAHRQRLEKELAEVKAALAKRAEPPPPPPAQPPPPPSPPKKRYVAIYRGLESMTKYSIDESSVKELAQRSAPNPRSAQKTTAALAEAEGEFEGPAEEPPQGAILGR